MGTRLQAKEALMAAKAIQREVSEIAKKPCPLTPRETEILQLVADGMFNKNIASHLHCDEQTVKNHMIVILRKVSAKNRTHAVVIALANSWIDFPDEKRMRSK